MRKTFSSGQLWSYSLLVVALSPMAASLGWLWGWTPGAAALAVLAVPTCAAALSGNRMIAYIVALVASAGLFSESMIIGGVSSGSGIFSFPFFGSCVLFAAATIIATVSGHLSQRAARLEKQNTLYVRELYGRDREASGAEHDDAGRPCGICAAVEPHEPGAINFAMLLLTLQDIGRRVSTNLNLDTLIPTIINTSRASLKCEDCSIYLWNAAERTLTNPLVPQTLERAGYSPRPDAGMSGWVLKHRKILTRGAVESDYSLRALQAEDPKMPDAIAPLVVGNELLGLLVIDKAEHESNTFTRMLYILANVYALGIKNAQLFRRIEEMARTDGLTGLLNHASFHDQLEQLSRAAAAHSSPLAVIMADVDHFKAFNDTRGHQAGDHVLREVAQVWKAVLPDYAVCARYGGEEFICALPHDDLDRAYQLAELARSEIEGHTFDFEGQQLHVTVSMGVADTGIAADSSELVKRADEALYGAKQAGRNRVVCCARGPRGFSADGSLRKQERPAINTRP